MKGDFSVKRIGFLSPVGTSDQGDVHIFVEINLSQMFLL